MDTTRFTKHMRRTRGGRGDARWKSKELIDAGDYVVAPVRVHGRGRASGGSVRGARSPRIQAPRRKDHRTARVPHNDRSPRSRRAVGARRSRRLLTIPSHFRPRSRRSGSATACGGGVPYAWRRSRRPSWTKRLTVRVEQPSSSAISDKVHRGRLRPSSRSAAAIAAPSRIQRSESRGRPVLRVSLMSLSAASTVSGELLTFFHSLLATLLVAPCAKKQPAPRTSPSRRVLYRKVTTGQDAFFFRFSFFVVFTSKMRAPA